MLAFAVFFAACAETPCFDLARRICNCQRSEPERTACREGVDRAGEKASDSENKGCARILERGSCTCERAQSYDTEACGFLAVTVNELKTKR